MLPVIILAGGLATRLRPITEKIPKSLVEIHGRPFLDYQMRLLTANGIERAVLSVAYKGEMIEEYLGNGSRYGIDVSYSYDGPVYLGTAGAIRKALPQLGPAFFTLYGDSYLTVPFAAVGESFLASGKDALMTVYRNEGLFDTSNVAYDAGRIVVYDKKVQLPSMRHIDYGLGVFRASVFEGFAEGEVCDLAAVYQDVLRRGQLAAYEAAERFYEIGTPEGIADTSRFLERR
ncbi:MAG TPA: nucleotidyltransferase family protein [Bryobacteraceae bacterium]|nr:nucleotidyltransferase family protein [Bryobacteraceae bacterium]